MPYVFADTFEAIDIWQKNIWLFRASCYLMSFDFWSIVPASKYISKNKNTYDNSFTITYIKILVILTWKFFQLLKTQDNWNHD